MLQCVNIEPHIWMDTLRLYRRWRIPWPDKWLSASQEGLLFHEINLHLYLYFRNWI